MVKHTSVVELNGNRYDAVSGQIIGATKNVASTLKSVSSGTIDGFVKARPVVNTIHRKHVKRLTNKAHRTTQRSKTLMRSAVSKPKDSQKAASDNNFSPYIHSASKKPLQKRLFRAKTVDKNKKVSRFSNIASTSKIKPTQKGISGEVLSFPGSKSKTARLPKPLPSMVTSASHQKLEKMLDMALIKADSHKQEHAKKRFWYKFKSPKALGALTISVGLLMAAGIYAWQNVPQFSVRVASAKAHVNASIPAYVPANYGLAGPISASSNAVTMSYKDRRDLKQRFDIVQKKSNSDSTTLLSTMLKPKEQIQTSQLNGTTVYIYGNKNNAMWVSDGMHYELHDHANLDSDEVLHIAQSM